MKKTLICLFALLLTTSVFAQSDVDKSEVLQATRAMVELYDLSDAQTAKMKDIQERRLRNLNEIDVLKDSDYKLYLYKRRSVRQGAEGEIRRILNDNQIKILEQQIAQRRNNRAVLIKKLRKEGAGKEEIQMAILEAED